MRVIWVMEDKEVSEQVWNTFVIIEKEDNKSYYGRRIDEEYNGRRFRKNIENVYYHFVNPDLINKPLFKLVMYV